MKRKNYLLAIVFFILVSLALAACGDSSPTSTAVAIPAATTAPAPTTAATTAAATTTAVATTAAKTTTAVATTAAPTTSAAKTTAVATTAASNSSLTLPAFANTTEVNVPKEISTEVEKQLKGATGAVIRVFGSTDDLATLAASVEKSLTGAGYASALPGMKGFEIQKENAFALFTKAASSDLLLAIVDISTQAPTASNLGVPGLSASDAAKFATELKGKKSMLLVMGAKDLVSALTLASGNAPKSPVAATTAVSSVDASLALEKYFTTLTEIDLDPEVAYAVTTSLPNAKNLYAVMAASDADYLTTAKNLDQLLTTVGYKSGRPAGAVAQKKLGDVSIGGVYSMAGQPDVIWAVTELAADFDQTVKNLDTLQVPGLDKADLKKFFGQIAGKKSFLVVISGNNVLS